jgi:hypothetical protein
MASDPDTTVITGPSLRRFARDTLAYTLPAYGHGYQDGGCLTFAQAMIDWSGGAFLMAAVERSDRPGRVQHVVAVYGAKHLDSDGVFSDQEMLQKMVRCEGLPAGLVKMVPMRFETYKGSIPFYPELRDHLVQCLTARFGAFLPDEENSPQPRCRWQKPGLASNDQFRPEQLTRRQSKGPIL